MAAPSRGSILSPNVGQRKGADLRGRQNRAALLQCVRESAPVSRRGLSEETGIRPNTVGVIVAELIEEGILVDVGEVVGRRGRRRRLLDFAPQSHVLGAEIFEGAVRVGAMDLRGEIRDFEERPLESHDRETVLEILESMLRDLAGHRSPLGAGVAVAGIVDSSRGVSRRIMHFDDWTDVPLAHELEGLLGVPVRLGNLTEVRLIALKQRGLIQPGMTSVLVVLEPGAVGCGIVAEGQVLRGAVEASSELGQTWVISRGECVRLEELTEWPHLRDRVRRLGGESPGSLSAFLMGSGEEISAVRGELATDLGRALANLVFLIKPSHLWLTGSLVSQGGPFVESLSTEIHGHLLPAFSKALTIETLDNGPESGVIGAGGLILDLLFAAPVVRYF